jgi:hypothetical protein
MLNSLLRAFPLFSIPCTHLICKRRWSLTTIYSRWICLLVHATDQGVDVLFTVTCFTTFDKVQHLLVLETTQCRVEFEWPQKVAGLLEVRSNGVDFVDQIFHTNDTILTKSLFNDGVVRQRDAFLVDLSMSALVDQFTNRLQVRSSPGDIRFDQLQHLHRAVVQTNEDSRVDLTQAQQLENFARLGSNLVDTLQSNKVSKYIKLSINEVKIIYIRCQLTGQRKPTWVGQTRKSYQQPWLRGACGLRPFRLGGIP